MAQLSGGSLYFILIVIATGISASQVAIKYAATAFREGVGIFDWRFIVPLGISLSLSAVTQLVWLWVLQFVGLARAYMVLSSTFILVPIASAFLFHDSLSPRFTLGIVLIVIGVFLTVQR
jgi:drug/metabolite transporter (DMT)-like permease